MFRPAVAVLMLAASTGFAQAGATVEGRVVSSAGNAPIPKADIVLRAAASDRASYMTRTDASGRFVIASVAPGLYTCAASRAGFAAQPPNHPPRTLRLTVAQGQPVDPLLLRLAPLGVISGRVFDPEGQPVANANVDALQFAHFAMGRRLTQRLRATSDDRGIFRLFDLYPGTYYLLATPLPEGSLVRYSYFGRNGVVRNNLPVPRNPIRGQTPPPPLNATYFPGAMDPGDARAVDVTPGAEAAPADIHLQRRGVYTVSGKAPVVEGVRTVFVDRRPPEPVAGSTRVGHIFDDGTFEVSELASGSYLFTAMSPNPQAESSQYARAVVQVADHDVDGLQLTFAPAVRIFGILKAAGQTPFSVAGMPLSLRPVSTIWLNQTAVANPQGSFAIGNLVPDEYHVMLGLPAGVIQSPAPPLIAAFIVSVKLGDAEAADGLLDLRGGSNASITVTVSADMGSIVGKVTGDDGQPAPAYVTLVPDSSKWDWQTRYQEMDTDPEGNFTFAKVVPGRYRIFAWTDIERGAALDAGFRGPFEKMAVAVEVQPNGRPIVEAKIIDPEKRQ